MQRATYYGIRVGTEVLGPIPTAPPTRRMTDDAECWHGTAGAARDYRVCSACVWLMLNARGRRQ